MLVLHPSSRCDVCLDPYSFESPSQTPHAIPCGHVFCKVCLTTVQPPNCPLCRKAFLSDRIKKLHVDRPESLDETKEVELLQRLVLTWDASEAELLALLEEIEAWLNTKDEDENMPLRKAVGTLAKYQKLKTRRMDDHRMIKRLKDKINLDDEQKAYERETSKAIETSLHGQVEALQTQLSTTQEEILRLRSGVGSRPGTSEIVELQQKIALYESELEQIRPLASRITQYEQELERLRHELERYAYPVSSLQNNPLPPPPEPVSYSRLPTLAQAIASSSSRTNLAAHMPSSHLPYGNAGTSNTVTSSSPNGVPSAYINGSRSDLAPTGAENAPRDKKGKGKEREAGPTYELYPSRPNPVPKGPVAIMAGATPRQRVIPTTPNPSIPPTDQGGDSGSESPDLQRVDPARDWVDPYSIAAAYVSEYATGYGAGYQFAEYTEGTQAAVGIQTSSSSREEEDRDVRSRPLESMTSLHAALLETPQERSVPLSRNRNSQQLDGTLATAADSLSLSSSSVTRDGPDGTTRRRNSRSLSSQSQNQTQATGYPSDASTISSVNTGTSTTDSSLSRERSVRHPSALTAGNNVNGSRPRTVRNVSLPVQLPSNTLGIAATSTVPNTTAAADNRSITTRTSASSWGTILTHTAPLLDWQSTGGSFSELGLRTFSSNTAMPLSTDSGASGSADLDSWGPVVPDGLVSGTSATSSGGMDVNASTNGIANGEGRHGHGHSHAFPLRESDDERTPMSRSTRTLASNSSTYPVLDMMNVQVRSREREREREGERDRERERPRDGSGHRDRDRARSRDRDRENRRRMSHPASLIPAGTGDGTRHTQMVAVPEHATSGRSRSHHHSHTTAPSYSSSHNSQLWFESASYTHSPHSQSQRHDQSQSQSQSSSQSHSQNRRTAPVRRLSTSMAASDHHSNAQSAAPVSAPADPSRTEAGYYTDGPSMNSYSFTSPTLFSSRSSSNALGLDGLSDTAPLQITAPTPIVAGRNFLRTFSYDSFS